MSRERMAEQIRQLKKEKNAMIFAHYYQIPEVQDIADLVGDSLELARNVAKVDADIVIFCGVYFMGESAKILAPNKKILVPVVDAQCPMASMVTGEQLKKFRSENPETPIVCYVNSSAEVKAQSDICCTSSNALRIAQNIESDRFLFVPDQNLGSYIQSQIPEKNILLWEGYCPVHHYVDDEEVDDLKAKYPEALLLAHPEINPSIAVKADFVGSTSQIIQYANSSTAEKFIIGTEEGVLYSLRKNNPDKKFYILSPKLKCADMKKTSVKDIYKSLKGEKHEIHVGKDVREKALDALQKMMQLC